MRKSHLTLGRTCLGVLAAGVMAAAVAVPGAALASPTSCAGEQCFTVTLSSASAVAGATSTFTFTVANESARYAINSVTITAPAGMEITGAAAAAEPSAAVTPGSGTTFPAGSVIIGTPAPDRAGEGSSAVTGALSLAAGASTQLTVTAILPCADGSYSWGVTATDDGDNDSDDFQLQTTPSPASAVTGPTCSLAFLDQPASTTTGTTITSQVNSPGGPPVEVEVLSGDGSQLVTDSTAPVHIGVESNPGNGTLTGTANETASGGIASFPGLSINEPGPDYTLGATTTSSGITSATSNAFGIYSAVKGCSSASCSASASSTTTTGSVSTSSAGAGQFIGVGVGGVSYSCGSSYALTSDPVSFDLLSAEGVAQNSAQFTVVLEISKAAVQASGHPGASSWQICYASTVPFTAQAGTATETDIGGVTFFTGLLPDCSSAQPAPCVESQHKNNAGNEIVTFLAAGDPVVRS